MGNFIVKAARDLDLYFEYSSIAGSLTYLSTRAEMLAHLDEDRIDGQPSVGWSDPERRLQRADERGTSALGPVHPTWDDDGLIFDNRWFLPREEFAPFALALMASEGEEMDEALYEKVLSELADDLEGT